MGKMAEEPLEIALDDLREYLHVNHAVYMRVGDATYYLTDVNSHYWRAQDTSKLNEKKHYTDCTDLVPTISELLVIPFIDGKTIKEAYPEATFYASVKGEKQ
ncbi:MAG: CDP-alcohol phosphatidyltransferase [Atopobiaceae bacterium]|jgi:hypothetical protein|nr:CDP-alcohol phosphatidyltransferase [Atopobiaceae bacterium]MCH4120027.1 CDP-alcohol phosphatidyltransferase [Atopobiaceae bacterium]MCI1318661.1 CDP-alcohol phosphatidyltransferase [Atopobiaceae bacterium]MCI1389386.1 CDP-alcohol phosphatidyltransferase [Atopobiaceae bacterium]MCI1432449.1 CDP-alcohol phosphatidyltransferase [Atopobiaceae bacterium]